MPTVTFEPFDIVVVPFPFTDVRRAKRRPALVLSSSSFNRAASHTVMAMVTSAKNSPWPMDVSIADLESAGLPAPSVVRMKLFTIDNRLIVSQAGLLSKKDQTTVQTTMASLFTEIIPPSAFSE